MGSYMLITSQKRRVNEFTVSRMAYYTRYFNVVAKKNKKKQMKNSLLALFILGFHMPSYIVKIFHVMTLGNKKHIHYYGNRSMMLTANINRQTLNSFRLLPVCKDLQHSTFPVLFILNFNLTKKRSEQGYLY